jgi:hypothetical protein
MGMHDAEARSYGGRLHRVQVLLRKKAPCFTSSTFRSSGFRTRNKYRRCFHWTSCSFLSPPVKSGALSAPITNALLRSANSEISEMTMILRFAMGETLLLSAGYEVWPDFSMSRWTCTCDEVFSELFYTR